MYIDQITTITTGMSSFLSGVKLASIPAFANNLKKRNNIVHITLDDVPFITTKIKDDWVSLKPNDRKSWLDRKKWRPVEKELGADITNAIFDSIKDLPVK